MRHDFSHHDSRRDRRLLPGIPGRIQSIRIVHPLGDADLAGGIRRPASDDTGRSTCPESYTVCVRERSDRMTVAGQTNNAASALEYAADLRSCGMEAYVINPDEVRHA